MKRMKGAALIPRHTAPSTALLGAAPFLCSRCCCPFTFLLLNHPIAFTWAS